MPYAWKTSAWAPRPGLRPPLDLQAAIADAVECSCGVRGCRELGWPHHWNPVADDCVLCGMPIGRNDSDRVGSGYAHRSCPS